MELPGSHIGALPCWSSPLTGTGLSLLLLDPFDGTNCDGSNEDGNSTIRMNQPDALPNLTPKLDVKFEPSAANGGMSMQQTSIGVITGVPVFALEDAVLSFPTLPLSDFLRALACAATGT
jgi:hypothetical protein